LMEKYKDYEMMTRKNLPEQQEFVDYMREQTSVKELHEKTGIKKTTVEHWFRRDKPGFSHPSIEDWNLIKPHLKTIKYDNVMTALHSIEWKQEEMKMWRTPDAHCNRGPSSEKRMKMKLEKGMPISINDQVAHPNLMWPTPTAIDRPNEGNVRLLRKKVMAGEISREEAKSMVGKDVFEKQGKVKEMMWPTPTSTERSGINPKTVGGTLNPTWVEWLMGYPAEYTDLKDWEILSSRKLRKKSAKPSSKQKGKSERTN
jgi:hypothetical protein